MPFQPTREISMEPNWLISFLDVLVFSKPIDLVSPNIPRDYELEFAPIRKTWNMLNFLCSPQLHLFPPTTQSTPYNKTVPCYKTADRPEWSAF